MHWILFQSPEIVIIQCYFPHYVEVAEGLEAGLCLHGDYDSSARGNLEGAGQEG